MAFFALFDPSTTIQQLYKLHSECGSESVRVLEQCIWLQRLHVAGPATGSTSAVSSFSARFTGTLSNEHALLEGWSTFGFCADVWMLGWISRCPVSAVIITRNLAVGDYTVAVGMLGCGVPNTHRLAGMY